MVPIRKLKGSVTLHFNFYRSVSWHQNWINPLVPAIVRYCESVPTFYLPFSKVCKDLS
jgi:hypothetical protein